MLEDYGVIVGGKEGNLILCMVCGICMMKLMVSKMVSFGLELEVVKVLIDEFLEVEMVKGGLEYIYVIVIKVFKVNGKGCVDILGILGLCEYCFVDFFWNCVMDVIENVICCDMVIIYLNFYQVDFIKNLKVEMFVLFDLVKV